MGAEDICLTPLQNKGLQCFFDGQIYDAFSFIADLIGKVQSKRILMDNYVDVNTLNILCKKNTGVDVLIATAGKGNLSTKDINKFNSQ